MKASTDNTLVSTARVPGADYLSIETHVTRAASGRRGVIVIVNRASGERLTVSLRSTRHLMDALATAAADLATAMVRHDETDQGNRRL